MSKLLVVFGATGNQGSSVIHHILGNKTLSREYSIRAVTRDTGSSRAKQLSSQHVEVVSCDIDRHEDLQRVLQGAHSIFAMTTTNYAGPGGHDEVQQGKRIVDAALNAGASFLIWSTLPSPKQISNGKYSKVVSFDAKATVEKYIRSRPIRSAFYAPGSFMQNYATIMRPQPSYANDGSYVITRPVAPSAELPLVDIAGDTGKFVAAILADPVSFEGKTMCGATELYSMEDQASIISKATGKHVKYQHVSQDMYRSYLPPAAADELIEMLLYQEEFGYYGERTHELVKWSAEAAVEKPVGFAEFLDQNPLSLE